MGDHEGLVAFLYTLMRDHVVPGTVALLVRDHVEKGRGVEAVYSNKHLEAYARELAERILARG